MSDAAHRRPHGAWLVGLLMVLVASACRPEPSVRPGTTDYRVTRVSIEGVETFDEHEILESLATQRNRWTPFEPVALYNRYDAASDAERIQTFYGMHGYFDAEVVDFRVDLDDASRRPQARVTYTVDEGEPSFLAGDAIYHLEGLRALEDVGSLIGESRLRQGARFSMVDVDDETARLRRKLQEASYARAEVVSRVFVDRATRQVEVHFFFDPGVACLFGEIRVEGNVNIPDGLIRRNVPIKPETTYRQSLLRVSQVELYDMDAFTSVEVEALVNEGGSARSAALREQLGAVELARRDAGWSAFPASRPFLDHPMSASLLDNIGAIEAVDPYIPIVIRVSEASPASYKVGGGLAIETSRTQGYARGNAVWRNVIRPLNRAEVDGRLGYAWLPTAFTREPFPTGIVGEVEVGLSRPKVLFGIFDVATRIGFEHGLEADHAFDRPSVLLGIENRIGEFVRFSASYKISLNRTRDFANALEEEIGTGSCSQLPRAFRLGHFDVALSSDRRDPNLTRRRPDWAGSIAAQIGEAGLGEYPYTRITPDIRYYQPMGRRLSLATRVSAGVILDYGRPVPRSQCLFLGGGTSLRAWPERRVGPHVEPRIPNGGLSSVLLNVEPRLRLSRTFGLVAFLDVGAVQEGVAIPTRFGGAEGVHAGVGGGLRVYTPIGPFRFDLAGRLTQPAANTGRLTRLGFVLSLGEAF